jgi:D-alanine-D-alanine ligase
MNQSLWQTGVAAKMKIGLVRSEIFALEKRATGRFSEEYDSLETVEALCEYRNQGHSVVKLGGGKDFLDRILKEKIDFAFNISEGLGANAAARLKFPSPGDAGYSLFRR